MKIDLSKSADLAIFTVERTARGSYFYSFQNNNKFESLSASTNSRSGAPTNREEIIKAFTRMLDSCMPESKDEDA